MRGKIVIWGASGHAMVVADAIRAADSYEIVGLLDDQEERWGAPFAGATILGGRAALSSLRDQDVTHAVIAIGDNEARARLANVARGQGFSLATVIHPRATVAPDVRIGDGTVIAAGAVVNPGTCLGENVIVNTCASIDHECTIHDSVHISPGAHLAGCVEVGQLTWVGIGAAVKDRVRLGERSLIGAGAVVLTDIPGGVVAYGVPARVVREIVSSG
jgi:UDP-N-acetylbacillosamine N-acetyltransferase